MNNNDITRQRHHPRPSIRSASVYEGRQHLGQIEVDDHGRHYAIDLRGRRLGEFTSLKAAVGAFESVR
jgi:hypothetical protein